MSPNDPTASLPARAVAPAAGAPSRAAASPRRARRGLGLIAAAAAAALALGGCSSPGAGAGAAGPEVSAPVIGTPDAGAFPVEISHALGTTTLAEQPTRVAVIGWATSDLVLALGTVPVAIGKNVSGADADGLFPWFREEAERLGGPLPATLPSLERGEINFEELAETDPDLILATNSGITEKDYKRLTAIAPTVAYPEVPWSTPLDENIALVARALGATERATELRAGLAESIAEAAAAHPEFRGVSVAQGSLPMDDGSVILFTGSDPRIQLLEDLGFEGSPDVEALAATKDDVSSINVSPEEISTVAADIYVSSADKSALWDEALTSPVFASWGPVKNGSSFISFDMTQVMAFAAPSLLSVPWALDGYVDGLSAAVAKIPAP